MNYTVKSGDTLREIARRLTGDAESYLEIAGANNIANPDRIYIGQVLAIPDALLKLQVVGGQDIDYVMPGAGAAASSGTNAPSGESGEFIPAVAAPGGLSFFGMKSSTLLWIGLGVLAVVAVWSFAGSESEASDA